MNETSAINEASLESERVPVRAHCYRMLGSVVDAEDAVQDTMLRAWNARERFEARASVRSWLFRIATNVCLDMLSRRKRRETPFDDLTTGNGPGEVLVQHPREHWVEPVPDAMVVSEHDDPATQLLLRQRVQLAFVASLQHLSPTQRAVLLLRETLGYSAAEAAECLETSVAAVNSSLQRARSVLETRRTPTPGPSHVGDAAHDTLLARYMEAFGRYDIDALVAIMHDDVHFCMPPYALWLRGPQRIRDWMIEHDQCRGSRLVPVRANGRSALAQYRPDAAGTRYHAWAIITIAVEGSAVTDVHNFLDVTTLFPFFGLPLVLGS